MGVILTLVVVAFAMQDSYEDFGISILILFLSAPLYYFTICFKSKKKAAIGCGHKFQRPFVKATHFLQKLLLIASQATEDVPLNLVLNDTPTGSIVNNSIFNP